MEKMTILIPGHGRLITVTLTDESPSGATITFGNDPRIFTELHYFANEARNVQGETAAVFDDERGALSDRLFMHAPNALVIERAYERSDPDERND